MDATAATLAGMVRAKRAAIDNDLEVLRVRLQKADPRRIGAARWARWAGAVIPLVAGATATWWWAARRRPARLVIS